MVGRALSTRTIDTRAPGKLLLTGEYAVLTGAPAVVVSVGARATASLAPSPGMQLNVDGQPFPFSIDDRGCLHWPKPPPAGRGELLEAVVAELWSTRSVDNPSPVEIRLDSSEFSMSTADGQSLKLGLGSSAAVLSALLAALNRVWDIGLDTGALCTVGCAAHRRFQGGRGSGVDVATAVHGGVLVLGMDGAGPSGQPEALHWPEGLQLVMVWSGHSASTPGMIARLDAFRARRPAQARRHLDTLTDRAEMAVDAWRASDVERIMASTRAYFDALRVMDREAGIGIVTAAHEQLRALAEHEAAVYKTSGAGGGDLGFAMTGDPAVAARLRSAFDAAGYPVIDRALAVPGVQTGPA
ncbi:MAG TPA: hypothetical protein ENK16_02505 [Chromatiales bacterium]|nr:hypothetical protein [Chromatiales bacterium]